MQSTETNKRKNLKRSRSFPSEMPVTDTIVSKTLDDCIIFPVEEIVQYPLPGYGAPTSISFSPDDSLISYLFSPDYSLNRKVFTFDLKTPEEKLRRERLRERGLGVTRYEWVKKSSKKKTIMVPLPAGIYFQDCSLQPDLKLASASSSPIIDPHLSPDGTMLAYVRDYELHVLNLFYNESKQLTFGADGNVLTHGLAEYIAQEEMDRKNGYWWSLDSKFIAFTEVDSSEIPLFRIMHQGKSSVGAEAQEDHAYPLQGRQMSNERTEFRHLYLHDTNGACLGPITEGDWMVEQIACVNEAAGLVYFTGTLDGPLESHLYCAKLFPDGSYPLETPLRLTQGKGRHMVVLDHRMQRFVDVHDSLDSPPRISLCSLQDGALIMPLYEQPFTIPRFKRLQLESPEMIQIQANDGTTLYGAVYKPDVAKFGPPPYKTLISVYGGPSVQLVCDSWMNTVDMRAQYLRSKGILVWKVSLY
ncbi:prolyl oligopeptidase family protein [Actinidia rufa]|uniref:Prolyl oligopeptidase family protein n=1 Tax=Actinidia rufa TaxID=165716 RepID=A0A7J0FFZ5_9ERIC|nr:prolyl oligopeptidase family protein [Actinidia rufa]